MYKKIIMASLLTIGLAGQAHTTLDLPSHAIIARLSDDEISDKIGRLRLELITLTTEFEELTAQEERVGWDKLTYDEMEALSLSEFKLKDLKNRLKFYQDLHEKRKPQEQ